jgi:hypothetical protein
VVTDATAWLDALDVSALRSGVGGVLAFEKKAALGPFDVVPGRLVAGSSGAHRYGLAGTQGVILQAKVATDAFDPVVALVAPSGVRWDLSGAARAPDAGSTNVGATTSNAFVLPEAGDYLLLVSSRENLSANRAVTTGEYRLTLLCDAPRKAPAVVPAAAPSSRSGRFGAWESEPR